MAHDPTTLARWLHDRVVCQAPWIHDPCQKRGSTLSEASVRIRFTRASTPGRGR